MKKLTYLMLFSILFSVLCIIPAEKAYSFKAIVKVRLTSNSTVAWANLRINGRFKGKIYRGRVKFLNAFTGKTLRIEARNGTLVAKRTVRARRGMRTIDLTLRRVERKGTLKVLLSDDSDFPWATIYINGRTRGRIRRNRARVFRLASKSYTVKLQYRRVQKTKTVRVIPRRTSRVTLTLKRRVRYGRIQVFYSRRSQYRRAILLINDENKGRIRRGRKRVFRVKAGTHTVTIKRRGKQASKTVTVRPNSTVRVRLALRSRKGKIVLYYKRNSQYRRANVLIDDDLKGQIRKGQTKTFRIRPGRHTVTIQKGRRKASKVVRVRSGRTSNVTLGLKSRFRNVRITYRGGAYSWAYLFINDRTAVKIERGQTKIVRLSSARSHTIGVYRLGRVNSRKLPAGSNRRRITLRIR